VPEYRKEAPPPVPLLIQGLIGELPPRSKPFPAKARERWLAALKVNLDLVYGEADDEEPGSDHD
jgi:hypothetical protein